MTTTDYKQQAADFLAKHGLTFSAEPADNPTAPPPWSGDGPPPKKTKTNPLGHAHGFHYVCTIYRERNRRKLTIPFWGSIDDRVKAEKEKPTWKHYSESQAKYASPTAYDVLACISNDQYCEPVFEDWCAEFGYDPDSRKAEALHRRCVAFALELRQFFTDAELADLAKIQ